MLEFDNFVETELNSWFDKLNKEVRGNVVNSSKPTRIIPTPERRIAYRYRATYKQIINFINQNPTNKTKINTLLDQYKGDGKKKILKELDWEHCGHDREELNKFKCIRKEQN